MNGWEIAAGDDLLLVNVKSGTYYGCSTSDVRKTRGRLFSSSVYHSKPVDYHCIAWSEL